MEASIQQHKGQIARHPLWQKFCEEILPPTLAGCFLIGLWYAIIWAFSIPSYLLPAPHAVVLASIDRWDHLSIAVYHTFVAAMGGLLFSVVVGILFAVVITQSDFLRKGLYPYATILQTVPVVAIAPIIVVWLGAGGVATMLIAFIISVFPMISNTTLGLVSTNHNLINLMELNNASRWEMLVKLQLPSAMPHIAGGLRISSGLAVIGAIVGEFVAGIGGLQGGIGYLITVAARQLRMDFLFATVVAATVMGIFAFVVVNAFSHQLLKGWHESSVRREN